MPSCFWREFSPWRLQQFRVVPAETVRWTFGSRSGSAVADADGLITIPHLTVTGVPAILRLEK